MPLTTRLVLLAMRSMYACMYTLVVLPHLPKSVTVPAHQLRQYHAWVALACRAQT